MLATPSYSANLCSHFVSLGSQSSQCSSDLTSSSCLSNACLTQLFTTTHEAFATCYSPWSQTPSISSQVTHDSLSSSAFESPQISLSNFLISNQIYFSVHLRFSWALHTSSFDDSAFAQWLQCVSHSPFCYW